MKALSRYSFICALLLATFGFASGPTLAAEAVVQTEQIRAEMTAEKTTVAPGESFWVALSFDIQPKWHTYWSTPGDSGQGVDLKWTLPEGVTAGPLQYPAPQRLAYGDFMNFGYSDHVTMLTEIKVAPTVVPGPINIIADGFWLVCADICIPQDGSFTLPVTVAAASSGGISTPQSAAIAAALEKLPKPAPWPVSLARSGKILTLTAGPDIGSDSIANAAFFPVAESVLANAQPQTAAVENRTLRLTMTAGTQSPNDVTGVLVLGSGENRVGYTLTAPVTAAPPQAAPFALVPLLIALGLAFLGGIVLNVMPCVLPVLVMKAMSFISRGNADSAALRRDGLAYTAGVMVTFGALVGLLLALRAAGDAVGWGFQLQSPIFVAALAYIMLALGLNLSGVFNIGGTVGIGQELAMKGGATGSFFTGLLAVVVATPCTAPFMGTAIGFAMTQSPLEAILIFEALALGLAAPYLVLSFAPGMARKLPRPGPWMDRVKQVLAFPLYAAAAWLVWVLAQQLDATALAAALTGLVLIGVVGWAWGIAQKSGGRGRGVALAAAGLAFAATVALTLGLRPLDPAAQAASSPSEPYSEARLAELRAEGRPVFINFTAAWCITCKVNERIALSKADVEDAFKRGNVAYLRGDWTNRNAEITSALQAVGRDGVPLYLYYAPKAAEPVILPQVLTPATVIAAVNGT